MKKESAVPLNVKSFPSFRGNDQSPSYSHEIEGGFNKLEEAALRCLQGMMPICFNGKAFMASGFAVAAAFDYAEKFLQICEARRNGEETKTAPADESSQPTQSKLILS